jgi:hypothetical protein
MTVKAFSERSGSGDSGDDRPHRIRGWPRANAAPLCMPRPFLRARRVGMVVMIGLTCSCLAYSSK